MTTEYSCPNCGTNHSGIWSLCKSCNYPLHICSVCKIKKATGYIGYMSEEFQYACKECRESIIKKHEADIIQNTCPICKESNIKGATNCRNCGVDFSKVRFNCPACGEIQNGLSQNCSNCGVVFGVVFNKMNKEAEKANLTPDNVPQGVKCPKCFSTHGKLGTVTYLK